MKPAGLPILTYHAIDPTGAVTSTDPGRFAETLLALVESGHRPVDLAGWIAAGRPDLARSFAICFDDGLASILDVADLLVRHAIPATIFVVAGRIGLDNAWPGQPAGIPRARLLDRSELADLQGRGFRLGSHGMTHAPLDRLSMGELKDELERSRGEIERAFGRPCPLLAYPYGASDARVRRAAAGVYEAAFGTRLDHGRSGQDRFNLSRIDAYYLRSPRALRALAEDRWRVGLAVRRALRGVRRACTAPIGRMVSVFGADPARPARPKRWAASPIPSPPRGLTGRRFSRSASGVGWVSPEAHPPYSGGTGSEPAKSDGRPAPPRGRGQTESPQDQPCRTTSEPTWA